MRDMYGNDLRKTDSFGTRRDDWEQAIQCPVCGSTNLDGDPIGEGNELPNPDDEDRPLVGYEVVKFVCRDCSHRWVDGEGE